VRGDHRHRDIQAALGDVPDQIQPATVRHAHIGEAQGEAMQRQLALRFSQPPGARHLQPHAQQGQLQQLQDVRLVIHDQHMRTVRLHSALLMHRSHPRK